MGSEKPALLWHRRGDTLSACTLILQATNLSSACETNILAVPSIYLATSIQNKKKNYSGVTLVSFLISVCLLFAQSLYIERQYFLKILLNKTLPSVGSKGINLSPTVQIHSDCCFRGFFQDNCKPTNSGKEVSKDQG